MATECYSFSDYGPPVEELGLPGSVISFPSRVTDFSDGIINHIY